jgi:hypothetical protein
MNGQEWIALAVVAAVVLLQVRSWLGVRARAAKTGAASCGSCSGCPSNRAAVPGAPAPATGGACH